MHLIDLVVCSHAADIISAVEFDHDGLHLATGDRGGRVVLFERVNPNAVRSLVINFEVSFVDLLSYYFFIACSWT